MDSDKIVPSQPYLISFVRSAVIAVVLLGKDADLLLQFDWLVANLND